MDKNIISILVLLIASIYCHAQEKTEPIDKDKVDKMFVKIYFCEDKTANINIVQTDFNLDRQEVSEYMISRMNIMGRDGHIIGGEMLGRLMKIMPEKTFDWALDNFNKLTPIGRVNLAEGIWASNSVEAFNILFLLLNDKDKLDFSKMIAAGLIEPYPGPDFGTRVCDDVYNRIVCIFSPAEFSDKEFRHISISTPIKERDILIAKLSNWWKWKSNTILKTKSKICKPNSVMENKYKIVIDELKNIQTEKTPSSQPAINNVDKFPGIIPASQPNKN